MIDWKDSRERELRLLVLRAQYERHWEQQTSELVERELNRVLDVLLTGRNRDLTAVQQQRLNALYRELDRLVREGYARVSDATVAEMQRYAQLESDIARASVNAVLSTGAGDVSVSFYRLPKAYVQSIAKLPIQGLKIGDWYEAQAQTMSVQTKRIIQQGMIEGKGMAEISRRILAPEKAAAQASGAPLSTRAKREAKIIARTTVNAVQNDATNASNRALSRSVSDSYMWVSVKDQRTCLVAGTPILTPAGPRAIDTLSTGDMVVGGSGEPRRISATQKARTKRIAIVTLSDGTVIRCTPDHRYLLPDGTWCEAENLQRNQPLASVGEQQ